MISLSTRAALCRARQTDRSALAHLWGSYPSWLLAGAIGGAIFMGLVAYAFAQKQSTICVQGTAGCTPVSSTNPFPVQNVLGGVSCAAGTVSLTTMVVTNGIVTHC